MSKNRKLVIDQDKWLNASPSGKLNRGGFEREDEEPVSCLLGPKTGRMCCLGFAAKKAGLKNLDILGLALPNSVLGARDRAKLFGMFPWLDVYRPAYDNAVTKLTIINDSPNITLTERKRRIEKVFAEHGWDIEFIRGSKK